jgi:hypothetical protein
MTPILLLALSIPHWPVGPEVDGLHRRATEQLIERMFQRHPALGLLPTRWGFFSLDHVRSRIAFAEEMNRWREQIMTFPGTRYTPEAIARMRKEIEDGKDEVSKLKRMERECMILEQQRKLNPGVETDAKAIERLKKLRRELWPDPSDAIAPPPRELKK